MTDHRLIIPHNLVFIVALALVLAWANTSAKQTPVQLDYFLEVAPNLSTIAGRVCGKHLTPAAFTLSNTIRWQVKQAVSPLPNDDVLCLLYNAQLNAQKYSTISKLQSGSDIISVPINDLLPCPAFSPSNNVDINRRVSVELPVGKNVSFPGRAIDDNQYLLKSRPCSWSSAVVLGDIKKSTLALANHQVEVVIPASLKKEQRDKLFVWLSRGISALRTAYGNLPIRNFQVLMFPTGPNAEAVPWGQVMRGGGDSVHLYVDETKSLAELNNDWVLVHELSHLLHPYLSSGDAWLAEGFASYYQNVLRAREGLLGQEQAWQKLHAGFQRGLKQFEPHMTLEKNTRQMMRERKYMRVYWSGAAIALLADVHLRGQSAGKMSLDSVLKNLSECCLPTKGQRWRAYDLMQQLDATADTTIFSSLYEQYAVGAAFPDLNEAYEALGITRQHKGLSFDANPRAMHKRIMTATK